MRRMLFAALTALLVVVAFAPPATAGHALVVDDDGAQCPEAGFTSLQAAVDAADPGSTIRVCPGTYQAVTISGSGKDGLQLVADGQAGEVVVDGVNKADPANLFGIRLQGVDGARVEGFTVMRFHEAAIRVDGGSSGNTIVGNVTTDNHHDGIQLGNAHGNWIVDNSSFSNTAGNACGINVTAGSSNNVVEDNVLFDNAFGIQFFFAGGGNAIRDNESNTNRRFGIRNISTNGTLIEDNTANSNNSATGENIGIAVFGGSSNVTVVDNTAFGNAGIDIFWDGTGTGNVFEDNKFGTASPGVS